MGVHLLGTRMSTFWDTSVHLFARCGVIVGKRWTSVSTFIAILSGVLRAYDRVIGEGAVPPASTLRDKVTARLQQRNSTLHRLAGNARFVG